MSPVSYLYIRLLSTFVGCKDNVMFYCCFAEISGAPAGQKAVDWGAEKCAEPFNRNTIPV